MSNRRYNKRYSEESERMEEEGELPEVLWSSPEEGINDSPF
jgi:hypothetical protein